MSENSAYFEFMRSPKPARLNPQQVGWMLGIDANSIAVLARHGHLIPLGNPERNEQRFYALVHVEAKIRDAKWLHKVTAKLIEHHKNKNARRNPGDSGESDDLGDTLDRAG